MVVKRWNPQTEDLDDAAHDAEELQRFKLGALLACTVRVQTSLRQRWRSCSVTCGGGRGVALPQGLRGPAVRPILQMGV